MTMTTKYFLATMALILGFYGGLYVKSPEIILVSFILLPFVVTNGLYSEERKSVGRKPNTEAKK